MNATRQVAVHANASQDYDAAYFYHRKSELLSSCLDHGVSEFFTKLNDPDFALSFFDRVGPPPGYDDDFWMRLADSYKEGDHLHHHLRRQEYEPHAAHEEDGFRLVPLDNDQSIVDDVRQLLVHKYRPFVSSETNEAHIALTLDEQVALALNSQMQERTLLIQEFVQTGMPLLLNWLLSMPQSARFEAIEQCFADVVLLSPLDSILSARQRRHLLPEISDVPMLVGDGVEPLQALFVRIAGAQENNFAWESGTPSSLVSTHVSFLDRFKASSVNDHPAILAELDRWAREQAREHWDVVPAVLRLEHAVESALLAFAPADSPLYKLPRTPLDFDSFALPFKLYRTRGLQLLALSLIEKCLKTCLPTTPPTQNKKRKRHM